jgi:hypothetical protein
MEYANVPEDRFLKILIHLMFLLPIVWIALIFVHSVLISSAVWFVKIKVKLLPIVNVNRANFLILSMILAKVELN